MRMDRCSRCSAELVDGPGKPARHCAAQRYRRSRCRHGRRNSRFLDRETTVAAGKRPANPDRETFRKLIGAVDPRVPVTMHLDEVAKGQGYRVLAVRWTVFDDVEAEGLLLQPDSTPRARIVAIPDADWSAERMANQFGRRLVENGCQVLIPVIIDRKDTWSGIPGVRMTNQPHREWIYRMAFEAGRHIIGYEVQKVLAAVDWFEQENAKTKASDSSSRLWRRRPARPICRGSRRENRSDSRQRVLPAS